jgi:hypothetical protein
MMEECKVQEYESNNTIYDHLIKCENYELCNATLPKWWFECKRNYLCTNCDMMFGHPLEIRDNVECPICLETACGLSYLNCEHKLCVNCFKRCYYMSNGNEPEFPYSHDIREEFDEDPDNLKWKIEYPLIEEWNIECDVWYYENDLKYRNEEYLRHCSICRK